MTGISLSLVVPVLLLLGPFGCTEPDQGIGSETIEPTLRIDVSDGAHEFACYGELSFRPAQQNSFWTLVDVSCGGGGPRVQYELSEPEAFLFFDGVPQPTTDEFSIGYINVDGESIYRTARIASRSAGGEFQIAGTLGAIQLRNGENVFDDASEASFYSSGVWRIGCTADGIEPDPGLDSLFCNGVLEALTFRARFPKLFTP